jgi:hypothetical protein
LALNAKLKLRYGKKPVQPQMPYGLKLYSRAEK